MKLTGFLLSLLLLVLLGAFYTATLVIEDAPGVSERSQPTPADLRRARARLRELYDNAEISGQEGQLEVSADDMELVLGYLLNMQRESYVQVGIDEDIINLRVSSRLDDNLFGSFLNARLSLIQTGDQLALNRLYLGELGIPDWLATKLLQASHQQLRQRVFEYEQLIGAIRSYSIEPGRLTLSYRFEPSVLNALSDRGQELFISEAMRKRLQAHLGHLDTLLEENAGNRSLTLARALRHMLLFAATRSGDAVEENRTAILVLGLYQLDVDIRRLLQGTDEQSGNNDKLAFTLYGRQDSAQHFIGSAALALGIEPGLADSITLRKELDDSGEGGSGFSFTDLAADRAGIRLAQLAVADEATALLLQQLITGNAEFAQTDLMFDFRDLPELLDEEQFRTIYGDTQSPQYIKQLREIDERIELTPLFRELLALQ